MLMLCCFSVYLCRQMGAAAGLSYGVGDNSEPLVLSSISVDFFRVQFVDVICEDEDAIESNKAYQVFS